MSITLKLTDSERINYDNPSSYDPARRLSLTELTDLSEAAGLTNVTASLLYNGFDWCAGEFRVPLRLDTDQGVFVAKVYHYGTKESEISVLEQLDPSIAPEVRYLGDTAYIEEHIDLEKATNLDDLFDKNPRKAIIKGAHIHAQLANRGLLMHIIII